MTKRDPMIHVRVPDELKATLEKSAKANGRSMNAEIVYRLEESVNPSTKMDLTLSGMDAPAPQKPFRDKQGNITVGLKVIDHPTKGHQIRVTHLNDVDPD
ncbi:Arc family DNA-binding protein [Komagataeibacter oboediens]|nr:Arc family DNA-binding protein [Komagataeibacter oboediens]